MNRPVLVNAERLARRIGARTLFEGVAVTLYEGDRVGLVGPNGAGKTTLLRILAGLDEPDEGVRVARRGLRTGFVEQEPSFGSARTVEEAVEAALAAAGEDHATIPGRVAVALGRAGFDDPARPIAELSGGWRKRLAIVRALAPGPDLLFLDEPTNHLDLEGILWLEQLLAAHDGAYVVVSHDRYVLEHVAEQVLDLDRVYPAGIFAARGRYSDFLEQREAELSRIEARRTSLANVVRREIEWLRRGPKARTTKSQARIDSAGRKIDELRDLEDRAVRGTAGIDFTAGERRSKRLLWARGVSGGPGEREVFTGLELLLGPGSRVGVLGPNGSGKTTLLRVLAGQLPPRAGTIERAQGLRTVFFEQDRGGLDPDLSLRRALAPDGDAVVYRGREIHVAGWAERFLFRSDQLDAPVHRLSGGERARIHIARLMLRPADVLLLDEPTNDLDIPTLEVLEDSLEEFGGALVLVTHDRYLLERTARDIVALDDGGRAELFAGYAQWDDARRQAAASAAAAPGSASAAPKERAPRGTDDARPAKRKLSYQDQREWDGMEERILAAEEHLERCRAAAEDPAVASDAAALQERLGALAAAQADVERLYARWAELEAKLNANA